MPDTPSPYKTTNKDGYYVFTTTLGLEYSCIFTSANHLLSPVVGVYDIEVHTFDFFNNFQHKKEKGQKRVADKRVSATIKHLLSEFFITSPNRVIIFVCDSVDNRGKCRNNLFMKWFENAGGEYKCQNIEIEMPSIEPIYGAVITRSDFLHNEILKEMVIDQAPSIMLEKFGE